MEMNLAGSTLKTQSSVRTCTRCVSNTTISSIKFDENGVCNFCRSHDRLDAMLGDDATRKQQLDQLIAKIKAHNPKGRYNCIIGVSGGTDSSYTLHLAKQLGLRPLAVHFDNGWNTEKAVRNIENLTKQLDIDLYTYVVDWEEFKNLQISFLKASVPCIEAPTDVAIHATLYKLAAAEGVRYILGGQSYRTEGTVPREWSYLDGNYIESVHKQFGSVKLKSYPNLSLKKIFYYTFIRGIRQIPFLNYFDYDKTTAKKFLKDTYGWDDYGGHHYENYYSKFAFGWYLPNKFGIDKRIISLSGPVRSGMMTRDAALKELESKPNVDDKLVEYCINKLGITAKTFEEILKAPNKIYRDYFTSEQYLKLFRKPVKLAVKMGVFTPVLYEKYFE